MMIRTGLAAATIAAFGMIGPAQAATLSGDFFVLAVNAQNQTSAQSEANSFNFISAQDAAFISEPGYAEDGFSFSGALDFATVGGATTVLDWLSTSVGGVIDGLDASFGNLLLSKGSIDDGSATTTFFFFVLLEEALGQFDMTITHDDGVAVFDGLNLIGGSVGPNSVQTTFVSGFIGSRLEILYVATNSDPSILNVDVAPVPLPAALPLLAVAVGGLGLMRLRRKAA